MRYRDFELSILGRHSKTSYVYIPHDSYYTVHLVNHNRSRRCAVTLIIDGKEQGTFQLSELGSICLERPVNSDKRFTFYKFGTQEAEEAGLVDDDKLGLVQARFTLERDIIRPIRRTNAIERCAGGTGLSGHSSQRFTEVDAFDLDESTSTLISLRLIPTSDIEPLQPVVYSTPIPPKL